jgi:hypothetical protein
MDKPFFSGYVQKNKALKGIIASNCPTAHNDQKGNKPGR